MLSFAEVENCWKPKHIANIPLGHVRGDPNAAEHSKEETAVGTAGVWERGVFSFREWPQRRRICLAAPLHLQPKASQRIQSATTLKLLNIEEMRNTDYFTTSWWYHPQQQKNIPRDSKHIRFSRYHQFEHQQDAGEQSQRGFTPTPTGDFLLAFKCMSRLKSLRLCLNRPLRALKSGSDFQQDPFHTLYSTSTLVTWFSKR